MHMLEVALLAQFAAFQRQQLAPDEPAPQQWPRPRRRRAATAALAAVGIVVIVVVMAVAGSGH